MRNPDNQECTKAGTFEFDIDLPDLTYLAITPMEEVTSLAKKVKAARKLELTISQFQLELKNAMGILNEAFLRSDM